jgi:hypothetical protein
MIEGMIDNDVGPTFPDRDDQLDLVVKVLRFRRIGNRHPIIHNRIWRLHEEKRWFAVRVAPHLLLAPRQHGLAQCHAYQFAEISRKVDQRRRLIGLLR